MPHSMSVAKVTEYVHWECKISIVFLQKYDSTINPTAWPANFYYDNVHNIQDMSSSTTGYEISNGTSREDYRGFSSHTSPNYHLQGKIILIKKSRIKFRFESATSFKSLILCIMDILSHFCPRHWTWYSDLLNRELHSCFPMKNCLLSSCNLFLF